MDQECVDLDWLGKWWMGGDGV